MDRETPYQYQLRNVRYENDNDEEPAKRQWISFMQKRINTPYFP